MKRIYVLFSSLLLTAAAISAQEADSLPNRKALIFGVELTGPVIYAIDNNWLNYEAYVALRLNHKFYIVGEGGYSNYKYDQYNYSCENRGAFMRIGTDINLLKTEKETGNNFVGIGFRYGLAIFKQETPWFKYENYWGEIESEIPEKIVHGHFLSLSGGIKAELFDNIFIGWTIRVNMMLYNSSGKENRPVSIPGMGGTDGTIEPGISFHLAWQIPLKQVPASPGTKD
jgi:hypothetical protein